MLEPLAILAGPTAVGKTALALPVAEALHAEIINVDSRQLYRYMDIGTAKPSPEQQARVPHHMLDLLMPHEKSTAAQFLVAAQRALDAVQQRGKRALVVAGSGLYLQALLYGLMPVPAACEPLRRVLHRYADQYGSAALHRRLQWLDPEAAAGYHPHDRTRLVRALEVIYLTGIPFSSHRARHQAQEPVYRYTGVVLTRERSELYARIAERTDAMLAAGWLAEVESLLARGYTRDCMAMDSLGYRELLRYLAGEAEWQPTVLAVKQATCHFAKRQLTWFRKMPNFAWLNLSGLTEDEAVTQIVRHLQAL
ncbi:MAG: tRNA (adenosine(37)-N6)-dimethylallyltransferase MiaA [Candidatus Tectimicrobiota bacterium]